MESYEPYPRQEPYRTSRERPWSYVFDCHVEGFGGLTTYAKIHVEANDLRSAKAKLEEVAASRAYLVLTSQLLRKVPAAE